nr:hypothetical protein [Tanacetum cinerariifolium]
IEYVNALGYPSTLRNVSAMLVNALYQPWRAILAMINMCLTSKTAGYDRPRHPVLQSLWRIIHNSNIDYAEKIWEEFVQSIQTFLTDLKNLATTSREKKKTAHLLIPSVRFTKLIIHHLKTKHNIHPRSGSPLHYSHDENAMNTLRFVGKDGREIFGMPIPDALFNDEIKRTPYYGEYQQHVANAEDVLVEEPAYNEEETNLQRALELILKEQAERTQGPAHPVVIMEPDSRRIQPLPYVQGKGKGKGKGKEKFLRSILEIKMKARLDQTLVYKIKARLPSKDQLILEEPTSSTGTLSSLQNLEKELSFTNQFFMEKQHKEEPGKTNAEAEVQSIVLVPIHQDTSSVPPMTTLVIDLTSS